MIECRMQEHSQHDKSYKFDSKNASLAIHTLTGIKLSEGYGTVALINGFLKQSKIQI